MLLWLDVVKSAALLKLLNYIEITKKSSTFQARRCFQVVSTPELGSTYFMMTSLCIGTEYVSYMKRSNSTLKE